MPPKPKAKVKAKAKGSAKAAPNRITNARTLREKYAEIRHAPDGVDPEPLTVPKCVECPYCNMPVFPRTAKVATKRTYERAGINRDGTAIEKDEKKAEEPEKTGEEEEDDDNESLDTVDRLRDENEELQIKLEKVEEEKQYFEELSKDLQNKVAELEEQLKTAEDRIDFLEEAEVRWREKCSDLRVQNDELRLYINEQAVRISDTETDMVNKILFIRALQAEFARYKRRRGLMLDKVGVYTREVQLATNNSFVMRFWRYYTFQEKARRVFDALEAKRQEQVLRIQQQLALSRALCSGFESKAEARREKLRAAGHQLLLRSFPAGTKGFFAVCHAFRAWNAACPIVNLESQLHTKQLALEDIDSKLMAEEDRAFALDSDLNQVSAKRDALQTLSDNQAAEIDGLVEQLAEMGAEREAAAEQAKARAEQIRREAEEAAMAKAQQLLDEARAQWELEKRLLEEQLDILRGGGGGGGPVKEVADIDRIVPKGQGVLCCGCLKQIVHRSVKPLPPMAALKGPTPKLEKAQRAFFQKELGGMPDPDDPIHAYAWEARKDPFGATKYTPQGAEMPALWQKSGSRSKLTPLRVAMRDFKPANFR